MNVLRRIILLLVMTTLLLASNNTRAQDEHRPAEGNMASPYMPIESWVYPALDELATSGAIQSSFSDLHPWTRMTLQLFYRPAGGVKP